MIQAMTISAQIAKQFRELHFGGNWTAVNLKDELNNVNWRQATTSVQGFNSIATLVAHTHYYVTVVTKVLNGEPLTGKDADSFGHAPILSDDDWQQLLTNVWADAERFAILIEQFPDNRLGDIFVNEKYGHYYRNFTGIIEHTHYHLGQIVLIKKLVTNQSA